MNDHYTKIILTIIAIMLTKIALQDIPFFSNAHATFYAGQNAIQTPYDLPLNTGNVPGSASNPAHVVIDGFSDAISQKGFPVKNLP